jgi:ribA/ribD-fused uncharacterized protein
VEHYFHAPKFSDPAYRAKIRSAETPKKAASLGRARNYPLRQDSEEVKDGVMKSALLVKFHTHERPRMLLLSTMKEKIVENAPGDYYWGCGADGSGLNRFGELLMQVRDELRSPVSLSLARSTPR